MPGTRTRRTVYYVAVSADGFIADKEGGVHWLDPFNSPELGYDAFLAKVGAVVLGRGTYDQALEFGPWPYEGRKGLIVTSHPIGDLPEGVVAVRPDGLTSAMARLRTEVSGDIWVVGGGQTGWLCLRGGLLDEIELYVVPVLLGDGIPLFMRHEAHARLELVATTPLPNGVVMLRYTVAVDPA